MCTKSGERCSNRLVSVCPACASAPATAHGTQAASRPSYRRSATALANAGPFPPWPLTNNTRFVHLNADLPYSTTTVSIASAPIEIVPANPSCSPLAPYSMAGAMTTSGRACATALAIRVSVSRGRCGPCCSKEPTGTTTVSAVPSSAGLGMAARSRGELIPRSYWCGPLPPQHCMRIHRGIVVPRRIRQLSRFTPLSVGCSRRSTADTDQRTSVGRTPICDPARSPPATPCDAASGDDDRTTRSDCRDPLGHHRSSEQYDEHRTTPTVSRTPETHTHHHAPPTPAAAELSRSLLLGRSRAEPRSHPTKFASRCSRRPASARYRY